MSQRTSAEVSTCVRGHIRSVQCVIVNCAKRSLGAADDMKRREFVTMFSCAAAAALTPSAARAQQSARMRRLGILLNGPQADPVARKYLTAFEQPLRALGWIEGQNIQIDRRWTAGDPELTRRYAPEFVANSPDVLVALSSSNLAALQQATRSIPSFSLWFPIRLRKAS